jgi:hypothetical protein
LDKNKRRPEVSLIAGVEELKNHLVQAISEALGGRSQEKLIVDWDRKLEAILALV